MIKNLLREEGVSKNTNTAHDWYQRIVGEVGISRREFLYEMRWWEILMASRGYNHRHVLTQQLIRLAGWSSYYAFRKNEKGELPEQWMPLWFDENEQATPLGQEDVDELKALIRSANKKD